jgi:hypothetical protein
MPYLHLLDANKAPLVIPAAWAICPSCSGNGGSSAYLGAFTREDLDEAFDPEAQEAYFAGEFDRPCTRCHGTGKVLEAVIPACSFAQKRALVILRRDQRDEAEYERMCEAERRMGA